MADTVNNLWLTTGKAQLEKEPNDVKLGTCEQLALHQWTRADQ